MRDNRTRSGKENYYPRVAHFEITEEDRPRVPLPEGGLPPLEVCDKIRELASQSGWGPHRVHAWLWCHGDTGVSLDTVIYILQQARG